MIKGKGKGVIVTDTNKPSQVPINVQVSPVMDIRPKHL